MHFFSLSFLRILTLHFPMTETFLSIHKFTSCGCYTLSLETIHLLVFLVLHYKLKTCYHGSNFPLWNLHLVCYLCRISSFYIHLHNDHTLNLRFIIPLIVCLILAWALTWILIVAIEIIQTYAYQWIQSDQAMY